MNNTTPDVQRLDLGCRNSDYGFVNSNNNLRNTYSFLPVCSFKILPYILVLRELVERRSVKVRWFSWLLWFS